MRTFALLKEIQNIQATRIGTSFWQCAQGQLFHWQSILRVICNQSLG